MWLRVRRITAQCALAACAAVPAAASAANACCLLVRAPSTPFAWRRAAGTWCHGQTGYTAQCRCPAGAHSPAMRPPWRVGMPQRRPVLCPLHPRPCPARSDQAAAARAAQHAAHGAAQQGPHGGGHAAAAEGAAAWRTGMRRMAHGALAHGAWRMAHGAPRSALGAWRIDHCSSCMAPPRGMLMDEAPS